jgi:hypothetical protein
MFLRNVVVSLNYTAMRTSDSTVKKLFLILPFELGTILAAENITSSYIMVYTSKRIIIIIIIITIPITEAERSKARNVFARLNTEIMGSNPTRGMDVCVRLFCVCVVLCRERPCDRADHSSKEPYRLFTTSIISELILNGNRPDSRIRQRYNNNNNNKNNKSSHY